MTVATPSSSMKIIRGWRPRPFRVRDFWLDYRRATRSTSILYGPVLPTDISRNVDAKVKSSEDNEEAETKDDTNDGVGLTKESSDASWPERPLNHRLNLPLYHTFLDDLGKRIVLEVRTLVTARGHGNTKCWAFKFCVNPTRPLIELLREVYIMAANEHYEPLLRLVPHEPMLSRNCREDKVYVDGALVTIVDGTNASRGLRHGSVLGVHPDWHADCFQCDLWMRSWLEGRVPRKRCRETAYRAHAVHRRASLHHRLTRL